MIECVNGWFFIIVFDWNYFFVDGFWVNVLRLGLFLGCDLIDVLLLGIVMFEDGYMYGVGFEGIIDGWVEEEMYDVVKEIKGGKFIIKYLFSFYKCFVCWEIMEFL